MNTPSVTDGPPVVGPGMVVEGGNGRVMGIRMAQAAGAPGWTDYQQSLAEHASAYGMDASKVQAIKDPVLVRVRAHQVTDRPGYARELNQPLTNALDSSARTKSDASAITSQHLDLLSEDDHALSHPANRPFMGRFISNVVPEGERPAMFDSKRNASASAIKRAQDALFHKAYGSEGGAAYEHVLSSVVEDAAPEGVNLANALRSASGVFAKLESMIQGGERKDVSIAPELMKAAAQIQALRDAGSSVDEYLNQGNLFGDTDPLIAQIMNDLDSSKRSAKKTTAYLKEYARLAMETSDPNQESLFSKIDPTKAELWTAAVNEVNDVTKSFEAIGGTTEGDGFFAEAGAASPSQDLVGSGDVQGGAEGSSTGSGSGPTGDATGGSVAPNIGTGPDASAPYSSQVAEVANAEPVQTQLQNGKAPPLVEALDARGIPSDNIQLKKWMTEIDGKIPDALRMKEGQEALEVVIGVQAQRMIQELTKGGATQEEVFQAVLKVYQSQPNLNIRTSTSMENQAYSTPVPLSYLAGLLGDLSNQEVYEPTAGNGLLLINANPGRVHANELDLARFRNLSSYGFPGMRNGDALTAIEDGFVDVKSMGSVIANPPFGTIQLTKYDGATLGKLDHLIAAESLRAMKDNGRAVLILGASMRDAGPSNKEKIFLNWLASRYNVIGNFEVSGDLYSRQGASGPVRVLTINGRNEKKIEGVAGKDLYDAPKANTWTEVFNHATEILGSAKWNSVPERIGSSDVSNGGRRKPLAGGRPSGSEVRGSDSTGRERGKPERSVLSVDPGSVPGIATSERTDVVENGGGTESPLASGLPEKPGSGTSGGTTGPGGIPVAPDGSRSAVGSVVKDPDALIQRYTPSTYVNELDHGVFVPTNLVEPMQEGYKRLLQDIGDPVEYLQKELGYTPDELRKYLMGLQAESVASAINQIKQGKAIIIADDTGIGKGRQGAALIRWAIKNNLIPVFVTEMPSLFSTMHGDLVDIGSTDIVPHLMNSGESIESVENGVAVKKFVNRDAKKANKHMTETGTLPAGCNALFTTYSQFNKANVQRTALNAISKNAILIMDESHNASGEESNTGSYFKAVLPNFKGVGYFSATWAKRAGNTGLYFRTGLGDLGMDTEELTEVIQNGGYALQGNIAQSLAMHGQFIRRERSFENVIYETVPVKTDISKQVAQSDAVTEHLRSIIECDKIFHDWFKKNRAKFAAEHGLIGEDRKPALNSVAHSPFTSIVQNAVRQLALGLKADAAADMAIESLRNNEAPTIVLESTMGSLLTDFANSNNLSIGDPLNGFSYASTLSRYLERTRYFTAKSALGGTSRIVIPLNDLPSNVRAIYNATQAAIESFSVDIPASPIDWIRYRIQKEGYKVAEITGRNASVDYSGGAPVLAGPPSLKSNRESIRRGFNERTIDALIINRAGATGISLHADSRWTDLDNPIRRHAIIVQPSLDINIFKQALGRFNRTGQVIAPRYSIMTLALPSEIRPISNLQRKLKGLNSSTSSNVKGSMDVEGLDILNKYGDDIVSQYLTENPSFADKIGIFPGETNLDLATSVTGMLALLPVADQRRFYEEIGPIYNQHIDYLTRTGQNKLIQRVLDLDAREISRSVLFAGTGVEGPFSSPAYLLSVSAKSQGKVLKAEDVKSDISETLSGKSSIEHLKGIVSLANAEWKHFLVDQTPEVMEKANNVKDRTLSKLPLVGSTLTIEIGSDQYNGVVTDVSWKGSSTGNPFAASKWDVRFATSSASSQYITLPLTRFLADCKPTTGNDILDLFTEDDVGRQTRQIVVGNLLGSYTKLKVTGEIVSYTDDKGSVQTGMILPNKFNAKKDVSDDYQINDGAQAVQVLKALQGTSSPFLISSDGMVVVSLRNDGNLSFEMTDTGRSAVVKVSKATGLEFAKGKASVHPNDAAKPLTALKMIAQKSAMEDAGIIQEGVLKPEAFLNPLESGIFENITEQTIRLASSIIEKNGGGSNGAAMWQAINSLTNIKSEKMKIGDLSNRIDAMAQKMETGDIQPKELRSIIREIAGRMGKVSIDAKADFATRKLEHIQELARHVNIVASHVARAAMYQRMSGRSQTTGLDNIQVALLSPLIKKDFPFLAPNEYSKVLNHYLWAYNHTHPEDRIEDLSDKSNLDRFTEYVSGTRKMNANPWAVGAAATVGIGALAASGIISPALLGAAVTGLALGLAVKGFSNLWNSPFLKGQHSIHAKLLAYGENGRKVAASIFQVRLRKEEIENPANRLFDAVNEAIHVATAKASPNFVRRMTDRFAPTSEAQSRDLDLQRAVSDYWENGTPLPPEIEHVSRALDKLKSYLARTVESVGGSLIEDHFHRVYNHEGLRELKKDPAAIERLANQLVPQILANDLQGVERWREKFPSASDSNIAFNMALHALNNIYDASPAADKELSLERARKRSDFAADAATREGDFNRKIYDAIMASTAGKIRLYTSPGMRKRTVNFQLPEKFILSDGVEVDLIDRNFSTVIPKYVDQLARHVAQQEAFDTKSASLLLKSIGPSGTEERRNVEEMIAQGLNNRVTRLEGPAAETLRSISRRWKAANSLLMLGANINFFARDMAFASPKSFFLSDTKSWARAGMVLAKTAFPGTRNFGTEYKDAVNAGVVFKNISDAYSASDPWWQRAMMSGVKRAHESVSVTGYFLGKIMAPKILDKARHGDATALASVDEIWGPDRAMELLNDLDGLEMTDSDLDRAGRVYRNWISGTGDIMNMPRFMTTEAGRFWFQFMTLPIENTKFFVDRVHGAKSISKYLVGAAIAGSVALAINGAIQWIIGNEESGKPATISQDAFEIVSAAEGFQAFRPLAKALMGDATVTAKDLPNAVLPLPARQITGLLGVGLSTAKNISLGVSKDVPISDYWPLATGPASRFMVNDVSPLAHQLGYKLGVTDAEKAVRKQDKSE